MMFDVQMLILVFVGDQLNDCKLCFMFENVFYC